MDQAADRNGYELGSSGCVPAGNEGTGFPFSPSPRPPQHRFIRLCIVLALLSPLPLLGVRSMAQSNPNGQFEIVPD